MEIRLITHCTANGIKITSRGSRNLEVGKNTTSVSPYRRKMAPNKARFFDFLKLSTKKAIPRGRTRDKVINGNLKNLTNSLTNPI